MNLFPKDITHPFEGWKVKGKILYTICDGKIVYQNAKNTRKNIKEERLMINKLIANIKKTNAPIVVGLDPMLNYIPEHIQKKLLLNSGRHWKELQKQSGSIIKESWMRHTI